MILLILLFYNVNAAINPYGHTIIQDFANCINSLVETNFDKPGLLIFGNSVDVNPPIANIRAKILKKLHESLNFSVEIATPNDTLEICDDNPDEDCKILHRDRFVPIPVADYFVIIVHTFKEYKYLANKMIRSRSWNPYAKFIIFLINFSYTEKERIMYVEYILTGLFKHNVINILVGVPQSNEIRNAFLYSWKPYDPPRFCGNFNETARNRLILEDTCEKGTVKKNAPLFYNKLPTNMNRCILNILAIERQPFFSSVDDDPNIEKVLVKELLRTYNFTIKYKNLDEYRGERDKSGMWNGALRTLVAKEGHILLGGIFPDFDVHEDFECSSSYLADSYAWVVPRADPSPRWLALVVIFKISVWYSIGAGFVLCVLSWKILGLLSGDTKYHRSFGHCFLNTCIVFLGFSAYVRPIKQNLRIFFVFLNLYCTLLITAYQTKLIDVLQNPTYENQVDTIEELVESGFKFGGTEELHDLFSNSNDPFDNVINEKWVDVGNIRSALIDVAVFRNFSVLCSRLELAHLSATMPELSDRFGKLRYYTFELNTFSVPVEMIALRGFPFMKKFSSTLKGFKQLGINEGVRRRFASFNMRKRTSLLLSLNVKHSDFIPLSMQHLQGGFHILIVGFISGIVVLFIEIILNCKYLKAFFIKSKK